MTAPRAYYNEIDQFAAAWLRELIKANLIAPGDVDERDIRDVLPSDLNGYTQCHFFAGIGGWSYALRLAGWPDDRPAWTGSCPCQPFSAAGKRAGTADNRHLWSAWFHLIEKRRPSVVFGEQVEAAVRQGWLDLVQADLEESGYAVGAVGLCAAGIGAPHIRQRLYFVADRHRDERRQERANAGRCGEGSEAQGLEQRSMHGGLGSVAHTGSQPARRGLRRPAEGSGSNEQRPSDQSERPSASGIVGHSDNAGSQGREQCGDGSNQRIVKPSGVVDWRNPDWLPCLDGKTRPVEPGTFPLAHGIPARVGRLRGYGNAIVPQVAAAFVEAFMEALSTPQPR